METDWTYEYWLNPEYKDCDLSMFRAADTLPAGVCWHVGMMIMTPEGFSHFVTVVEVCFQERRVYIHLDDCRFERSENCITESERERWRSYGWRIDYESQIEQESIIESDGD